MNFNKVIIAGRVTRDIELRQTTNGTAVTDISLAVNKTFMKDGEKKEETVFVDVTLWNRAAEIAHQFSGKGQPLHIEGRLAQDVWEDRETGAKRSKLKVVGENIQLLSGPKENQGSKNSTDSKSRQDSPNVAHPSTEPTRTDEHNKLKHYSEIELPDGEMPPF